MQIISLSEPQKVTVVTIFTGIVAIVAFVVDNSSEMSTLSAAEIPKAHIGPPQAASTRVAASIVPATTLGKDSIPPAPAASKMPTTSDALASAKKMDVWSLGNSKSATPQIPLNNVIRDYEAVEVDPHPAITPQVGEAVSLPMLNGKKIVVDVQATTLNPNGDKSWSGHLQGYGEDYPIIMTYGEHAIFAMITTPEGSYTMESTDGVGWLYKNPSELELSDTGSKDFLEMPNSL